MSARATPGVPPKNRRAAPMALSAAQPAMRIRLMGTPFLNGSPA